MCGLFRHGYSFDSEVLRINPAFLGLPPPSTPSGLVTTAWAVGEPSPAISVNVATAYKGMVERHGDELIQLTRELKAPDTSN
jgi:hypothetical protein